MSNAGNGGNHGRGIATMASPVRHTSTGSGNAAEPGRPRSGANRFVLGAKHDLRGDRDKQ